MHTPIYATRKIDNVIVEDSKGIPYVNYGHFRIDNVGFQKIGYNSTESNNDYYEYKRTGEVKYKDFLSIMYS